MLVQVEQCMAGLGWVESRHSLLWLPISDLLDFLLVGGKDTVVPRNCVSRQPHGLALSWMHGGMLPALVPPQPLDTLESPIPRLVPLLIH